MFGNKYVAFSSPKDPVAAAHHAGRRDRRVVGDHRVQHAVRDRGVGGAAGRPDQAEPDADRDRAGARRAGRAVRPVDRERQRDPGRRQPADAADPPGQPAAGRPGRRVRRRRPRPVRRPGERGHHRAHAQRPAGQHRPGADGRRSDSATPAATSSSAAGPYLVRGAADLVPTSAAARRVQPRAVLHHPQLPRRRAEGRRVARRQRLLAAHPLRGPRRGATRTSIPTTCRGSTPTAAPRAGPAAGSRSPATCGRSRTW